MSLHGQAPDVLVVGAGIVGAACARELSRAGLYVRVVDPNPPGLVATSRCMGHIVALDESDEILRFSAAGVESWRELAESLPADVQFRGHGTLWIQREYDADTVTARSARLRAAGVACDWVEGEDLLALEPALRPGLAGALRVPADASVYPPVVARHWILQPSGPGRLEFQLDEVVELGSGWVRLRSGAQIDCGQVVIAAGLASRLTFAGLPTELRPVARKGHLVVTQAAGLACRHQLLEMAYTASVLSEDAVSVAFNIQPRPRGQLVLGSSRSYTDDRRVEPQVVRRMLARAQEFVPGLAAQALLRVWAGLRPASPTHRPLIGPHPRWPGVWLATGHEGLGVTTAPVTAQLIRSWMTGEQNLFAAGIERDYFSPLREMGYEQQIAPNGAHDHRVCGRA